MFRFLSEQHIVDRFSQCKEMSGCVDVQILSPRMICQCGRTVREMTQEERDNYDHAMTRLVVERNKETKTATECEDQKEAIPIRTELETPSTINAQGACNMQSALWQCF